MLRACLVVSTIFATTTVARGEPTLAILAVDAKDPGVHVAAETLTSALRSRAKTGRFKGAGTPKTIAAATLKAECKTIERSCAVAIGTALAVDYVLSGEIEKRGNHNVLVLSLFDVRANQRVRSLTDTVASSADVRGWARSVYQRVVDVEIADLSVVANAQRGEVFIDGEVVAMLANGRATIHRVAIGVHRLMIRAKGFRSLDVEITVDGTTQSFLLEPEAQ